MISSPTIAGVWHASVITMDPSLRLASLTAFYFGAHVAAEPASPEVITSVSKRAYRDLNRTLHGIGTHPNKTTLLEDTHASLREFLTDLEKVTNRDDFDALHDAWCEDRIRFFAKRPHPDKEKFTFTYGQAQKWLNMTLKYLAVLDHPAVQRVYPYLHVPIDSIIYNQADQIGAPRPPKRRSWSRLNQEQYLAYQTQLRTRIAQKTTHSAPMDWESTAWIARNSATEN